MTEQQMQLPEGWEKGIIKNIVKIRNGYAFKSRDFNEYAGVPVVRQSNLSSDYINFDKPKFLPLDFLEKYESYKIQKGDVLIGLSGSIGNLSRYNYTEPALQNQRTGLLMPIYDEGLKYVQYYLQLIKKELLRVSKGVAVQNISTKTIENWHIPIAPKGQQKQIVAKIEELFSHIDAGIESLKIAKEKLKQYRQSVLKAAVTGELTKDWRQANQDKIEPADQLLQRILKERRQRWEQQQLDQFQAKGKPPKNDKWKEKYKELGDFGKDELKGYQPFPEGWNYTKLGNLIDEPKYGTSKKCSYEIKGKGVLRIPNVVNGMVDPTDLKYAEFDEKEIDTYGVNEGDVLTIRSNGSVNLVGKCALVKKCDEDYIYAGYLIRLRPIKNSLNPSYLILCMRSIVLRNQVESKAKSTSGVNNINSQELQNLIIPVCSIEEQKEIVRIVEEKLTAADRLMTEIDTKLTQAQQQKQTILASAFKGNL